MAIPIGSRMLIPFRLSFSRALLGNSCRWTRRLSVLDDPSLCDCSEPCPKCGKEMIFYHTEEHGSVWAECSDIENCGHIICKDDNGASAAALLACVRELEGKLATARLEFQNIVEQWVFRSEIFPTEEQCAATLADFARKALEKIGGKS